jgi:uncharacterized LabA/DUF88 family protein
MKGLRTLVFGMKELNSEDLKDIRDGKIDSSELERDFKLLGVTGVEDLL